MPKMTSMVARLAGLMLPRCMLLERGVYRDAKYMQGICSDSVATFEMFPRCVLSVPPGIGSFCNEASGLK